VPRRRSQRLADAAAAFASNARNPGLRRAQLAFAAAWASEWAFLVGVTVVAFRDGGAAAVGVVGALRMAPAALLAPFATALADRVPRDRILVWACAARAALVAAAAPLAAADGAAPAVYGLAVLATAAFTVVRPAHAALLPALCRTPQELTSGSVVRGLMDAAGTLAGPAAAAVLLAAGGPEAVFAAVAGASAWAAWLVARLRYDPPPRRAVARRSLVRETAEGFGALAAHREAALVFGIALAQTFTRGCLGVLVVVCAVEELGTGEAGVGVLMGAIGAGAVAGALGTGLLARGRDLARWEGTGAALWGLPLVAIAAAPEPAVALAALAVVGIGNALVDLGLFTLPVRLVPEALLGRVFGVFESLAALTVAGGSLAAAAAVDALGARGALTAAGVLCPAVVVASWAWLRRIDRAMAARDGDVALLRRVPLLRPLPVPAIEELALRATAQVVPDGTAVFEQGDPGDRFYVVEAGAAEVVRDGVPVRSLGPGDGFGEVALLERCRRTATVRSLGGLVVRGIERDAFLTAVTGHRPTAAEAQEAVAAVLEADATRAAP
jgi:hypothetical protein